MSKLATVELHSCILLISFHSACYLSNSGGFHAIKATKGRSLGGVAYIYIQTPEHMCIHLYIYIDIHLYIYICIHMCVYAYMHMCIYIYICLYI